MPELEPMVPTEIKKCDEPAHYSLQKRVLIDWPAILTAIEESSDSDCSSSIESYDSDCLNKSEDESSSSNGDTPPMSKKLKISPYFKNSSDNKKNIMKCKYFKTKTSDGTEISDAKEIMKAIIWVPPKSPYNLIQESLYQEPWKLLVATIFLNRTSGKVAIPLVWKFFDRWATPEAAYSADKDELAQFLQPMGLNNRRADQIMRFSYEFKHKAWLYPKELFGISKYGNDSFRIFCRNEWRKVKPLDHKLNMYHNWLCQNWKALGV
jgi:methyl-CpG-binding domain protein 4